jgi:hypothetical protein
LKIFLIANNSFQGKLIVLILLAALELKGINLTSKVSKNKTPNLQWRKQARKST